MPEYQHYKPLPKSVRIDDSKVHGQGLHAKKKIAAGTNLGVGWFIHQGNKLRFPLGGFVNHSDTPNCSIRKVDVNDEVDPFTGPDQYWYLIVDQDIKAGEELFVAYSGW